MEDANEAAILERRMEVRASLRSVENSLRDVGAVTTGYASAYALETHTEPALEPLRSLFRRQTQPVSDVALARSRAIRFDFDTPDDVTSSWKMLPLGLNKCRRIWSFFDADEDDFWTYDEFLEYLAVVGGAGDSVELKAFEESEEVWRMFMSDVCELDEELRLTFDGFVTLRERMEDERPLVKDLKLLGISLEWEELERGKLVKKLFEEYVDEEVGGVTAKAAQYLLAEFGFNLTRHETLQVIERRYQLARCLKAVLRLKRTLRLFGYQQKSALRFANETHNRGGRNEEQPRICEVGFSSLIFSAWSPSVKTRWRNFFLRCRLQSFCALKRLKSRVHWAFTYLRHAATTGLLSTSCLQSRTPGQDKGDYMMKLDVGPKFSTSATVHLTYNSDADSAATLHELKYLERGAECFLYVDLSFRSGTKENDAHLLVNRLTWFISEFFRDHIESLPFFHRWFVTLPTKAQLRLGPSSSEASGSLSTVVRLVILFTGEMDLYYVMQSLGLPSSMQFDHLLQRFSLRWLCSHSLEELLVTKSLNAGSQWCCRTQMDIRLNRQAWAQIIAQVAHQLHAEVVHEREVADYIAQAKAERDQTKKMDVRSDANQRAPQPSPLNRHGRAHDQNSRVPAQKAQLGRQEGETESHRHLLIKWLRRVAHTLEYSQQLSSTCTFTNLRTALEDQGFRSILSPQWLAFLKRVLQTPGGLASEWKIAGESLRAEFAGTNYAMAGTNRTSLGHRSSAASIGTPPTSRPTEAVKHSAREAHEPNEATRTVPEMTEEESMEDSLLEFYDLCVRHLQGIHVVRAEAGTSGVTCVLEGWNIFSLLPRIHQSHLAKKSILGALRNLLFAAVASQSKSYSKCSEALKPNKT